jgi:hypothetical protein
LKSQKSLDTVTISSYFLLLYFEFAFHRIIENLFWILHFLKDRFFISMIKVMTSICFLFDLQYFEPIFCSMNHNNELRNIFNLWFWNI